MIIKEIDLKNIRSHGHTTVNFTNGINIITGNTGSGKSSMLMALEYALFGKIGEGREEGKMLLRRGESSGTISLKLEEGGSEYHIKRGLKRVSNAVRNDDSENEITKNGEAVNLQNRASDLTDYVLRILKIKSDAPIKTFESITYIKQDELKDLIFDSGQAKQEYIDQLLQLNKYVDTYDTLKDVISLIRSEAEAKKLEEALAVDENDLIKLENRINELKSANKNAEGELSSLENEIKNEKVLLEQQESELKFYRDKKNEYTKLSAEKDEKFSRMKRLNESIEKINREISEESADISNIDEKRESDINNTLKRLNEDRNRILNEQRQTYSSFSEIKAEVRSKKERIEKIKFELEKLSSDKDRFEKDLITVKGDLETTKGEVSEDEINGRIHQLKEYSVKLNKEKLLAIEKRICPICGEPVKDTGHIEREYDSRLSELSKYIDELLAELEKGKKGKTKTDLEKEVGILESRMGDTLDRIGSRNKELSEISMEELERELAESEKAYEKISGEDKVLSEQISTLNTELESINKIRNALKKIEIDKAKKDSFESETRKLEEELLTTSSKLDSLGFKQEDMDRIEDKYKETTKLIQNLTSDISRLKGNIESRSSEITDNESKLDEIKIKIKRRDELRKEAERKENFLTLMDNLRKDIRDIREYVRNKFIIDFRSLFQSRFSEIRSENEYAIDIDNNYNVKLIANGETLDAKALSGGEKTSVALAYRMALSSIASMLGGVSKNESLLMDEPTSGLDKEDINALSSCITKITDINQIIIVTHEDTMKNIADNIISVSKVAGESKISS